jgi:hypothetical protein
MAIPRVGRYCLDLGNSLANLGVTLMELGRAVEAEEINKKPNGSARTMVIPDR